MRILTITLIVILICAGLSLSFIQSTAVAYTLSPSPPLVRNPSPIKGRGLSYPPVAASELTIQNNGAATLKEFIKQIILKSSQVKLSKESYQGLIKDRQGMILLPIPLIERALATNNFTEIRSSLLILKDFIGEQEKFIRGIALAPNNRFSGQSIVGFQRLTLNLIDRALQRGAGKTSLKEFQTYFTDYKYADDAFHNSIQTAASMAMSSPASSQPVFSLRSFMESELQLFTNIAHAQSIIFTPFGGKITKVDFSDCYCVGMVLTVDDYASKNKNLQLVLPWVEIFLLRGYKHPLSGYYILGLYLRGAGICLSGQYCSQVAVKDGLIIAPPTGTN